MVKSGAVHNHTNIVKALALELGFSYCGIAKAAFLEDEAAPLEAWLNANMHGQMGYMANHFDKRLDPRLLVPGAQSVVSLAYNYFPPTQDQPQSYAVSKYAYGEDYHDVIRDKLYLFLERIQESVGHVEGRVFVDSAPVLEKAWAKNSGVGWVGKNANLITKQQGSFFFLAELIIDLELQPDGPIKDYCGTCTRCIDACPTEAIVQPYVVDGSRCISYLTIELREAIPSEFKGRMAEWAFGCDICQDVCPWNRFSKPHQEERFRGSEEWKNWTKAEWKELTEETFKRVFRKSAVKRTKFIGLKKNIDFLAEDDSKR
jgi:epoxyqueuosine reductase